MKCVDCSAEIPIGAYFCDGCGRPLGFGGSGAGGEFEDPGLDSVPTPAASREAPGATVSAGLVKERPEEQVEPCPARDPGRGLCAMCMGSFPETALTVVDGNPYCADCSPLTGRRSVVMPDLDRDSGIPAVPQAPMARSLVVREVPAGGGGTKVVLAVLLFVLLGGGGYAVLSFMGGDRIDRLISGAAHRDEARLLVQKYRAGEHEAYEVHVTVEMDGDASAGGFMAGSADFSMSMNVAGRLGVDILEVDDRGNARMRVTMEGFHGNGELLVDGRPRSAREIADAFEQVNGSAIEMTVDPFGEPIGKPTIIAAPGRGSSMDDLLGAKMNGVPRHELRVGDTWIASEKIPLRGTVARLTGSDSLTIDAVYEVEGYKRFAGRDCMVISIEGERKKGAGSPPVSMPLVGNIDLDVEMKGAFLFDTSAGKLVKSAMDVKMEIVGESKLGAVEMRMKIEMDVELR